MRRIFPGALALVATAFCTQILAAETPRQSAAVEISSVKITGQNAAAYVTLNGTLWGTAVYSLDLSEASPYSREMLSLLTTAVNADKKVRFYVLVDPSPSAGECGGTFASPSCSWGARMYRVQLDRD